MPKPTKHKHSPKPETLGYKVKKVIQTLGHGWGSRNVKAPRYIPAEILQKLNKQGAKVTIGSSMNGTKLTFLRYDTQGIFVKDSSGSIIGAEFNNYGQPKKRQEK
ncbi:MAG: hypothetical protein NUV57_03010 [archaeon]|nr:hypothetical protein [archaeon]